MSACFCVLLFIALPAEKSHGQSRTDIEVLYLSDTGIAYDGKTTLFKVYLNTVSGHAELMPLPDVGYGVIPFDQVVAFACTPDGKKLYCIESRIPPYYDFYHHLGVYDQAAFSPDGILYLAHSLDDEFLTVETDPGSSNYLKVSRLGPIVNQATGATLDVAGADLVYAANGTLYLMINVERMGAPKGLLELSLQQIPGSVGADYKGLCTGNFIGLAIRANGYGDLVGSITDTGSILVIDRETGFSIASFPIYRDGSPYIYEFGDMSVGPQVLCNKTLGYWKNHSWNGAGITICDVLVKEDEREEILWRCRGNNYSMLFAQLIAAKFNTNNSTGIPEIEETEGYICTHWPSGWQGYIHNPIPKSEKKRVTALWNALDRFHNHFRCE